MKCLALFALTFSAIACASPYNSAIDAAARRHGIDPAILRTITEIETHKHPWSFNADGEGFKYGSKVEAVNALYHLNQIPWMVKILPEEGAQIRRFFPTEQSAISFFNSHQNQRIGEGKTPIVLRTDNKKVISRGEARVRKLWMLNTDIGIAQINYRYFGSSKPIQHWFDPVFNLDFAGSLLAKHKRKAGSDLAAAGLYHSGTKKYRDRYMKKFMPIYQKEKSRESSTLAVR